MIGALLTELAQGRGGVLVIEGPAGIGKSRLLTAALAAADDAGVRTLFGEAFEYQQSVPFFSLFTATLRADPPIGDTEALRRLGNSADLSYWVVHDLLDAVMEEVLKATHDALGESQRMLVEYKPFEPAFYHTDIADWGMALELARRAGPKAKVLVDTGHHYQGQNVEQIVAWLLDMNMLGGFHFNDRRYADDDLTMGSIDP